VSYHHAYLRTTTGIINGYKGDEPFSSFLKKYFAANKQHGSRDRKQISHLCYSYFRLGKAGGQMEVASRIVAGLFLSAAAPNELLATLKPEWNDKTTLPVKEKAAIAGIELNEVFPLYEEWSGGIDREKFNASFFVQPDLFLRIRPSQQEKVIKKLEGSGMDFILIPPSTLRLPPASKTDEWLEHDKEVVVQDLNSQRVGEFLEWLKETIVGPGRSDDRTDDCRVWDCCAASGGKSILAKDILGNIDLTVSDVRESILVNLKKRFERAGIKQYHSFISDLAGEGTIPAKNYDLVMADVPCTGSGTWSRTPEQLFYFDEKKIAAYASLQKKIVSRVVPAIKAGGYLLYITCSIFRSENEDMIAYLQKELHLHVVKMHARMNGSDGELFKGYELKADTLFAALLQRPL
jgi:16S rRNA (cytosine967-C5)-methyltransferase